MFALLHSFAMFVIDFFKSSRRLEAEDLFLRHQLSIALRRAPSRLRLRGANDRLSGWPRGLELRNDARRSRLLALEISIIWRSAANRCGTALIRRMSVENLLWGPTFLIGPAWGACAVKQNGVMAVRGRALGSGGARGSGSWQPRSKHSNAAKVISAAAAYVWFLPERREVP
jgi:hypothetical protein